MKDLTPSIQGKDYFEEEIETELREKADLELGEGPIDLDSSLSAFMKKN